MYKIRKITFHNHPILGNLFLDFCNPEGKSVDTVILAGENGTGKSTILNAIYMLVSQVADFEADVEYETNGTVFVAQNRRSGRYQIQKINLESVENPKGVKKGNPDSQKEIQTTCSRHFA